MLRLILFLHLDRLFIALFLFLFWRDAVKSIIIWLCYVLFFNSLSNKKLKSTNWAFWTKKENSLSYLQIKLMIDSHARLRILAQWHKFTLLVTIQMNFDVIAKRDQFSKILFYFKRKLMPKIFEMNKFCFKKKKCRVNNRSIIHRYAIFLCGLFSSLLSLIFILLADYVCTFYFVLKTKLETWKKSNDASWSFFSIVYIPTRFLFVHHRFYVSEMFCSLTSNNKSNLSLKMHL